MLGVFSGVGEYDVQVERIVVANHSTARVIMREAVDLRAMAEERGGGVGGGAATTFRSEVTL